MTKYFENFRVVEMNRSFYWCPREKAIEAWREKAQENFEFTVKTHQDVRHKA